MIHKKHFLLSCFLLSGFFLNAQQSEEAPRILLFLGRFHPVLLHLPIGALALTFFVDIIGRVRKDYPQQIITYALGFSAITAILTCVLGYFLSLEGGYGQEVLDIHFYTGILTAILASILFFVSAKNTLVAKKLVLPFFIATMISLTVAGHYGSVLTHGDNFLTEYAGPAKKEPTIEVVDSLQVFNDVIYKILDDKCIQCHNPTKTKGELSLISKDVILKGGESGEVLVAGNAHESLLYKQLLLPISDEDHMPPEGKPQLTKDEIWLLKHWIDSGLKFSGTYDNIAENDTLGKLLNKYLVFDKTFIPRASSADIAEVSEAGFRVLELVPGNSKLSVKALNNDITKSQVNSLSLLKEQIVELDFSNVNINDDMTSVFKKMKNLKMLRLDNTKVTDKSIKNIKNIKNLEVLNLFNTAVTNNGLKELLAEIQPENIYVWKTDVTKEMAMNLQMEYDVIIHSGLKEGFVETSQLDVPNVTPEKTLFVDTVSLNIDSKFKNVTVRYTLNGDDPDSTSAIFKKPIIIDETKTLKTRAFKKGWLASNVLQKDYFKINHRVTDFTIKKSPDNRYPDAGKLFDLQEASSLFNDGKWTGYLGYDVNTTIDLGSVKKVDNISVNCLENIGSWILFPTKLKVLASNTKNGNFKPVGELKIIREDQDREIKRKKFTVNIPNTEAQFFKIIVENPKKLPSWHEGAGQDAWIFVDEIFLW
ncbi:c-type cytochrome domain-containing protein [Aureibaculum sp. 2210JD6-5]|uniref:FN3 associated domain-containing protein n=1 Tax=Aureibaculum sp. 2210JD6-5 TaxID=3103957 RepID=UPI002AAE3479|nr:FN3 associated domain-containing protein [Aureibaculum sp. 2210JD6-5]MDY7395574.1 c-type cytochrome domain-containing protein [Aureibaculum sp. 2210JD6-5]